MEVAYAIAMSEPDTHLFEVTMEIRGHPGPIMELSLPSWIPGSYLIREFAKHVQDLTATSGDRPLPKEKVEKGTWRIQKGDAETVTIRYKAYGNELTVDTSHLDSTHGYFNGPCVFMYVRGHKDLPARLTVVPPAGWKVTTGLTPVAGAPNTFTATDYDHLVDCPVEVGAHELHEFAVRGVPYRVAFYGKGNGDPAKVTQDVRKIVEAHIGFWGEVPYEDYTFLLHMAGSRYNGLEHRNSTTCLSPPLTFRPQKAYEEFLGLVSHEFFHTWNVKRIRPAGLEPINYAAENYTRHLWLMEGITSYYGQLLLRRADLLTPKRYLEYLGRRIKKFHDTPGRGVQALGESSFDTWIKFYRPDDNAPNNVISYYLKGELLGLALDLETRHRSDNKRSLDTFMQHLWTEFGRAGKWIPEDGIGDLYDRATGTPLGSLLNRYLETLEDIPFEDHLGRAGLKLVMKKEERKEDEGDEEVPKPGYLGVETIDRGERVFLKYAFTSHPAAKAGLYADDEIIALNGHRVDSASFRKVLGTFSDGETVSVTVSRRGQLTSRDVTLGTRPPRKYNVERLLDASQAQKAVYADWLRTAWPAKAEKKENGSNGRAENGANGVHAA